MLINYGQCPCSWRAVYPTFPLLAWLRYGRARLSNIHIECSSITSSVWSCMSNLSIGPRSLLRTRKSPVPFLIWLNWQYREFARVFGVDFASVMFRGSQYKVESFIFRLAKPESFVLVSPSKQQVGLQNAPFAVPLIAEPESKYYNHPIIVLDFQSLYPSVMIAYNLCYSTCLGRVEKFKGTDKFGFTELKVADGLLELLKDYLTGTSYLTDGSEYWLSYSNA